MNVSLTPELEALIAAKLESGLYKNAAEVVREGLRMLQERDERRRTLMEELRTSIRTGIEQAARGETISADESRARVQAILDGDDPV